MNAELVEQVAQVVIQHGPTEQALQALRTAFNGIHFTLCSDDDVNDELPPIYQDKDFNLYLVDGQNHCLKFTTALESATGFVVAWLSGECD